MKEEQLNSPIIEDEGKKWNDQQLVLAARFKEFADENGLKVDPDGRLRFKDWQDALAFQRLAKESQLEVFVKEPSISSIKNKVWLADYYGVYPKKIIDKKEIE